MIASFKKLVFFTLTRNVLFESMIRFQANANVEIARRLFECSNISSARVYIVLCILQCFKTCKGEPNWHLCKPKSNPSHHTEMSLDLSIKSEKQSAAFSYEIQCFQPLNLMHG